MRHKDHFKSHWDNLHLSYVGKNLKDICPLLNISKEKLVINYGD